MLLLLSTESDPNLPPPLLTRGSQWISKYKVVSSGGAGADIWSRHITQDVLSPGSNGKSLSPPHHHAQSSDPGRHSALGVMFKALYRHQVHNIF